MYLQNLKNKPGDPSCFFLLVLCKMRKTFWKQTDKKAFGRVKICSRKHGTRRHLIEPRVSYKFYVIKTTFVHILEKYRNVHLKKILNYCHPKGIFASDIVFIKKNFFVKKKNLRTQGTFRRNQSSPKNIRKILYTDFCRLEI
jgi:hypothetical protein